MSADTLTPPDRTLLCVTCAHQSCRCDQIQEWPGAVTPWSLAFAANA